MGRSSRIGSAGAAGFALVVTAVLIFAIYTAVVTVADARAGAEARAQAESIARAVAVGSVAQLPKGSAAVVQSAGRIIGSQKPQGFGGGCAQQEVQIGRWDEGSQSFAIETTKPSAVRVTVRLTNVPRPFALVRGAGELPVVAQAVATLQPLRNAPVAEVRESTAAIR